MADIAGQENGSIAADVSEPQTGEESKRVPRIKLLPKPDDSEMKAQTGKLNDEIQAQKARINEVSDTISRRSEGRSGRSGAQQALKNQLSELRTRFNAELAIKQNIRRDLEAATKSRDLLRSQAKEMKGRIEYMSVAQIDEQVARLEQRMAHSTQSLQEERANMDRIKRLKASRGTVAQYNERLEQLNADDSSRQEVVERLQQVDQRLNTIKEQQDKVRGELGGMQAREAEEGADIPGLLQERNDCRDVVNALYAKIKEIRAEFKARNDEYYERQREFRKQQQAEREERRARQQAEWEERQKERQARAAEMAGEPFDKEVTLCEQLATYLGKSKAQAAAERASAAALAPAAAPVGYSMPKKKGDEELEAMFAGKGGKKGKGKRRAAPAEAEQPAERRLTHSLDMLNAFATLKVEVPTTSSKVEGVLEAIEARRLHYLARRQAVKDGTAQEKDADEADGDAKVNGTANGKASPDSRDDEFEQIDKAEAEGPEAEAAIAAMNQDGGEGGVNGTMKPTQSLLMEHDEAFPAIGAARVNGVAAPQDAASVAATTGGESMAIEPAAATSGRAAVTLTVGEDNLVRLAIQHAGGSPAGAAAAAAEAAPLPSPASKMSFASVL